MKYLKSFNENNDQRLSKSDIDYILNVFNDLVDECELYNLADGAQSYRGSILQYEYKVEYSKFVQLPSRKKIPQLFSSDKYQYKIPIYQRNGITQFEFFNSTTDIENYDFYIYINLKSRETKFLQDLNRLFIDRITSEFDVYLCQHYHLDQWLAIHGGERFIVCIKPKQ